ncbi:MAG: phage tail tape measure protein [Bacteroidaceae bacterium]|nr:phage tail tape measure protein [Bacteroidaceae bacterium]
MSDLTSKATVELLINGQQAQQTLQQLRQNALQLESAIAKAAATGNKSDLKRLRKELADTKRQIREMESATQQVEQVLKHLDKATPRELNKTLQTLNRQLEYIERGSEAWKAHVEKIKLVKAELRQMNAQLRDGEGFFDRMNRKINEWQASLMAGIAALTGFILAGRNAVKAFAEMEEELANTRKYTGMTEEKVLALNEAFKKMDTRTSREQLNELAQEAGRLGKNTLEDVEGYVEAADIINVALVDLGEGATQTIAKLTDIFGVSEMMGTRDAMLAVGSTVNVLSQNCTASKPYLVQFAQRMAGIGAQADLTIPQLLAFGATLDANGQKVEMSASALGKLTMNLFQKPVEIAQQVGLEVNVFTETLKRSTYEGLMMFLQRIHDLGSADGLAVLAPMFKDLGMDGVRMSQVLSTLAEHLDMVKWETQEANKAFKEATSATNEYQIFNNTVQADLDKARKRIKELAIELGEKLLPVMRHVYTSTSMTLRFLSTTVSFISEHRVALLSLTAAIVAYNVAINLSTIRLKAHNAWAAITTAASKAYEVVVTHLKTAHLALQVAMAKLSGNWARENLLMGELKKNGAALTNVYALLAAAVVAAGVAIVASINRQSKAQKQLAEIDAEARRNSSEDIKRIEILRTVIEDETRSIHSRRKAIEELQGIIPDYHASLTDEGKLIGHNAELMGVYVEQLKNTAKIQAALAKLPDAEERLRKIEKEAPDNLVNALAYEKMEGLNPDEAAGRANASPTAYKVFKSQLEEADKEVRQLNDIIDSLTAQNQKLSDQAQSMSAGNGVDNGDGDGGSGGGLNGGDGKDNKKLDKFAVETEWKQREEAVNRIAYAKGEKNYLDYTKRMQEIEVEYNRKKLEHTDLSENERLSIEAAYYEAVKKQADQVTKTNSEEEEALFNERMAQQKQRYIDGEMSYTVYEESIEQIEMMHLHRMVSIYEEGSKERVQAQGQLQDKLLANQRKHQKQYEEAEKKHQDALAKMKDRYFGDNSAERRAKYNADLALLVEVYNRELLAAGDNAKEKLRIERAFQEARIALMEQYNIEGAELNRNFLQQWNEDMMSFLESDLGQALSGTLDVLVSGMSGVFQQLTTIVQAELQIQTAQIEKRYEREISLAEGNNYKVKRLERQKEKEIAKVKNEANKRMFAMQVIQAVAQTATNAINAYGSAAAIPLVGYIIAPIAAATAVAAGMLQVAAIRKQQQASESQGYISGGFTRSGRRDEVAGVVHAGEWVASQELVNSPVARPLIEALDYAQRTNKIGSLKAEDVSRTITAPHVLADSAVHPKQVPQQIVVQNAPDNSVENDLADTIRLLRERLDEPFLTVNSVTGETGMKQAQDEYDKLIRNKTPKSRRS